jgi:hypothetical protein
LANEISKITPLNSPNTYDLKDKKSLRYLGNFADSNYTNIRDYINNFIANE